MKTNTLVQVLLLSVLIVSCSPLKPQIPNQTAASTLSPASATENVVFDIALSNDGSLLAVYANTGIVLYDTTTLEKIAVQQFEHADYNESMFGKPGAIAISPDKKWIAVSGLFPDTPVDISNLKTGKPIASIRDIPSGFSVDQLEFGQNGRSIYVRSQYRGQSLQCTQNGADTSFALYKIGGDGEYLHYAKLFEKRICIVVSPPGGFRFTENNKFFLKALIDMGPELSIIVNMNNPDDVQEYQNAALYDVSSDGNINAIRDSQSDLLSTTLIDTESGATIMVIPYKVKLLNDDKRFLVRGDLYSPLEWGLWEDGAVKCHYADLLLTSFDWELSGNNEVFITYNYRSPTEVTIWDVATCSVRNVIDLTE